MNVGHHRHRLCRELAVGLDPVLEGEASPAKVSDSKSDVYGVIERDLLPETDLQTGHEERNLGPASEAFSPEDRSSRLHVCDHRGVVDVRQCVEVAPANLDRNDNRETFHSDQGNTTVVAATIT